MEERDTRSLGHAGRGFLGLGEAGFDFLPVGGLAGNACGYNWDVFKSVPLAKVDGGGQVAEGSELFGLGLA